MSSGGFIDSMLNRVPGYAGYRDKERRRDSDRAIRENLAVEYGQLADRLGRLARTLAEERQIMAVGVVDKPHKALQSFINRVRTASYGYAPLFSENEVDASALDQLAAFDRSLADRHAALSEQIGRLEAADPKSPEFKSLGAEIEATVQGLDDRFDKRNDVLQSGKASSDANVLALLEAPEPSGLPVAYRLHEGEALAFENENYTVIGRVSAEADDGGWRAFQLRGGNGDQWLVSSSDHSARLHWSSRTELPSPPAIPDMTVGDATYTLRHQVSGTGAVIGQSGSAAKQPVRLLQYGAASGSQVLDVFDWGASRLALLGREVDAAEFDFFTREQ